MFLSHGHSKASARGRSQRFRVAGVGVTKHAQAGMKAEYERQLEQFRARRDEAMVELRRLQNASTDAWTEMMRGVDASMKSMQEAFERARRSFDKK